MRIKQLLESATAGGMSTASVATVAKGSKKMIKRQKPTDNALDKGKLFQEAGIEESDPCWKDYKQIGMKKKGDKSVPNCVPKESVEEESDKQFAQRMKKKAAQPPTKGMSQKEKEDKGWAKPKEQGVTEGGVDENKKGVRAVKHTVKPRNFVAKNAVQSGAGAHKDKKKAQKQGEVKHKSKEPTYESKLQAALDRRITR